MRTPPGMQVNTRYTNSTKGASSGEFEDYIRGYMRWDVAQLVSASDHHATDSGSIPQYRKGFSLQSTISADSYGIRAPLCAITCINICVHDKDPVVNVTVWWIMALHTYPACTISDKK